MIFFSNSFFKSAISFKLQKYSYFLLDLDTHMYVHPYLHQSCMEQIYFDISIPHKIESYNCSRDMVKQFGYQSSRTSRLYLGHANDWWLQPRDVCSQSFSGVIWQCATEINSIQLHDSFVMVPLETISLHIQCLEQLSWKIPDEFPRLTSFPLISFFKINLFLVIGYARALGYLAGFILLENRILANVGFRQVGTIGTCGCRKVGDISGLNSEQQYRMPLCFWHTAE